MSIQTQIRNIIIESICLLFVLLFVYAAVSKLIDFERFQVQIAQSPILSAYAFLISRMVISVELLIAVLLIFSKTRMSGLFGALSLMTMFTFYIYIVLNYSSFVPCSCGGILEKMTWRTHLLFNLFFVLLALIGIILQKEIYNGHINKKYIRKSIGWIAFSILAGLSTVVVLFIASNNIIHHKNPFIRLYPKDAVRLLRASDLGVNSYYFAGWDNQRIFLANYTDPLHLLSIDSLGNKYKIRLFLASKNIAFRSIKIVVRDRHVYLMDGTVPCIFKGSTSDWKLRDSLTGLPKFTAAQPLDSSTIALRYIDGKNMTSSLCLYNVKSNGSVHNFPNLLQKQIDGIFDTDGMLLFNEELELAIYTYFYRNQFFAFDHFGNKRISGNTIDTTIIAKIKVAELKDGSERQMAAPPLKVNSKTATRNDFLYISSKIQGRFEDESMWEKSSIIDVYNLQNKDYILSFYIQERPGQKMHNFFVTNTHLYSLAGNKLQIYSLGKLLKTEIKTVIAKP